MYDLDGFTVHDDVIIFRIKTVNVMDGDEYQIWYGEDINDISEGDNSGKHCVDVDISCLI